MAPIIASAMSDAGRLIAAAIRQQEDEGRGMRCQRCQGTGTVLEVWEQTGMTRFVPCPDCIGGTASCCEATDDPEAREEGDHD